MNQNIFQVTNCSAGCFSFTLAHLQTLRQGCQTHLGPQAGPRPWGSRLAGSNLGHMGCLSGHCNSSVGSGGGSGGSSSSRASHRVWSTDPSMGEVGRSTGFSSGEPSSLPISMPNSAKGSNICCPPVGCIRRLGGPNPAYRLYD